VTPKRIIFPIAPEPPLVFVNLVRRNVDNRTGSRESACGIEYASGANYVGRIRLYRLFMGIQNNRLSRKMNDDFGRDASNCFRYPHMISDVANSAIDELVDVCPLVQDRVGGRR